MTEADLTTAKRIAQEMERDLPLEGTESPPPEHSLFHYTTSVGLQGILKSKQIRATHYLHLNDRDEIVAGEKLVRSVIMEMGEADPFTEPGRQLWNVFQRGYDGLTLTRVARIYVASFTELGNDLSQWRAYGGQGGGYSIGFEALPFPPAGEHPQPDIAVNIEKVEYDAQIMQGLVRRELRRMVDGFSRWWERYADEGELVRNELRTMALRLLFQQAAALVTRFKNSAFENEREWRLVVIPFEPLRKGLIEFDLRPAGVIPFIPVSLVRDEKDALNVSRIYVGPTQDAARGVESGKLLARELDVSSSVVVHSGIPLRT